MSQQLETESYDIAPGMKNSLEQEPPKKKKTWATHGVGAGVVGVIQDMVGFLVGAGVGSGVTGGGEGIHASMYLQLPFM